MKPTSILVPLALVAAATTAAADPPKTLRVMESVEVQAPPDKVWEAIRDFDALNKWHPAIASDQLVSGSNGAVGAVRKLTIKDGPVVVERLTAYDDAHRSYSYRIVESPLPVSNYASRIAVRPGRAAGTTEVVWSGTFKRKNTSDNPPEAESDAGVIKLIKGVYRGGLDNLKKLFAS